MSEIQVNNDPDVITGHTEIISSTSIERIVTGRNAALLQIEQLIHQLDSISILTSSIGGKSARDWAMRQNFRGCCWLMENVKTAMSTITRNLDRSIWRDLMKKSGMISFMDAQARKQWDNNLEGDDIPEISEANILSNFEQLHHNKADVFERGIINVFKGLSWDYKTNSPYQFGKKIIVNKLVNHNRWGFKLNSGWRRDQLADLERMLFLLDGKPIPENCHDVTVRLSEHINQQSTPEIFDDAYFSIRYFQKGSAHITFNRPELIERMNDIIAKHYPAMLASR